MGTSQPRSGWRYSSLPGSMAFCAMLVCAAVPAFAQGTAPSLGTAESFAVLGGSTVTNTGPSSITGNLGVSPGTAVTGFPPGVVTGTIHSADAVALQAQADVTTAYLDLAAQACDVDLTGDDLGTLTLTAGVYCFPSTSAQLTGDLVLDAEGDPDAVFIVQIGSTLTTASNSSVVLINGAQPCNVFFQVGSSATLGTATAFVGNVLALASITLTTGASLSGRALAQTGAVTLDTNDVMASGCHRPRLRKSFSPATIEAGEVSRLTIMLINRNPNPADLTAALVDTLPSGLVIAATPNATTTCAGTGAVIAVAGETTVTLPETRSIPAGIDSGAGICTVKVNVTAAVEGTYVNTLAAGALQTSNGNNTNPASATLTVEVSAPRLRKSFNPTTIDAGDVSRLTIVLINRSPSPANLTMRLRDDLPSGVVIAPTPNAATTCQGTGAVIAVPGRTAVTLPATRSIPPSVGGTPGTCTVKVNVTGAAAGTYVNTLGVNALQTTNGNNTVPAFATLIIKIK